MSEWSQNLEKLMAQPMQRTGADAVQSASDWSMGQLDNAITQAGPQNGSTRSYADQLRRQWSGSDISSSGASTFSPGDIFSGPLSSTKLPSIDASKLRDSVNGRYSKLASLTDAVGGPFVGTNTANLTQSLSARNLDQSVASMSSALAAKQSLAAAGMNLHSNRQGSRSPMAANTSSGTGNAFQQAQSRANPTTTRADATGYSQKDATVSGQMEDLMSQDSNLMKQARTAALQGANSRGLLNSSMAVGASQDAMAQTAMTMAQQDAGNAFNARQAATNQGYTQENLATQQDYTKENAATQQQYSLEQMAKNQDYALEQMDADAQNELNQLFASSSANAWGVMSNNITDIVAQSMDAINNIQASSTLKASDKTKMIKQVTSMRNSDIKFQQDLYKSLGNYLDDTNLFPSR